MEKVSALLWSVAAVFTLFLGSTTTGHSRPNAEAPEEQRTLFLPALFFATSPAVWEIENVSAGDVLVELAGYDARTVPPGVFRWEDLAAGVHDVRYTFQGDDCSGYVSEKTVELTADAPTQTRLTCPLATWEVYNRTGGDVVARLVDYDSYFFPSSLSQWTGIKPARYRYVLTVGGGVCNGQFIEGGIHFLPGETIRANLDCTNGDAQFVAELMASQP